MDKLDNRIFDLLKNEHFVQWVQNPSEESNHYWTKWISNHQESKKDVEIARRMIQSASLRYSRSISEESYDEMLENIMNYARAKGNEEKMVSVNLWRYAGIAAACLIVAFISILLLKFVPSGGSKIVELKTVIKEAPYGSKLTTRLPDGTIVTLNSGSILSFPEKFEGNCRKVDLIGEAFFEVEHDNKKPFYVRMNGDEVKVLGTSFSIRFYPEDNFVNISVATGRVSYSSPSGDRVILLQDEMATYIPSENRLTVGTVNQIQAFGWKERIIYFESITFGKLKIELERWYGVEIIATDDFGSRGTYSGEFNNPTLSEILNSISFVYRFDFKIEGNKVILTKAET